MASSKCCLLGRGFIGSCTCIPLKQLHQNFPDAQHEIWPQDWLHFGQSSTIRVHCNFTLMIASFLLSC